MPCFFARLLIVSPAACPSRSCSNSSTLSLLSIPEWFHPGLPGWAKSDDQSGPNQSIELIKRQNSLFNLAPHVKEWLSSKYFPEFAQEGRSAHQSDGLSGMKARPVVAVV